MCGVAALRGPVDEATWGTAVLRPGSLPDPSAGTAQQAGPKLRLVHGFPPVTPGAQPEQADRAVLTKLNYQFL